MRIGILSRGPQLYSTRSLYRAGQKRGHKMLIIDHTRCQFLIDNKGSEIFYEDMTLSRLDAIIPRIGSSVTLLGASLIYQFELLNVYTTTRANALLQSRDKLRCLQKLAGGGLKVPGTAFVTHSQELISAVRQLGGFPVVIKLLESTHGVGVMLAENMRSAQTTLEAFQKLNERVMVQEFIPEAKGADVRALVVGNKVVAAMKRQAREGEFRSNLHRGATARAVDLTTEENTAVITAARSMGLAVAGVDLLRSQRGPLIMEVNASPGLEGIETVTGVDVAGAVIQYLEKRQSAFQERKRST